MIVGLCDFVSEVVRAAEHRRATTEITRFKLGRVWGRKQGKRAEPVIPCQDFFSPIRSTVRLSFVVEENDVIQ